MSNQEAFWFPIKSWCKSNWDSKFDNLIRNCGLISDQEALEYDVNNSKLDERLVETRERLLNGSIDKPIEPVGTSSPIVQTELVLLALPAIAWHAIEPLAQLMETAYIGRLGALELASAGVSISIFNIVSKVFSIPLRSVATSFVAEDKANYTQSESDSDERRQSPSVSTTLVLSIGIGKIKAAALYFGAGTFLSLMGISSASSMRISAQRFLKLRALGAPAVVLSLAIQDQP